MVLLTLRRVGGGRGGGGKTERRNQVNSCRRNSVCISHLMFVWCGSAKLFFFFNIRNWDSSVSIATTVRVGLLRNYGSIPDAAKIYFSLLRSVQTSCVGHPSLQ
jgi:hypothetical protein